MVDEAKTPGGAASGEVTALLVAWRSGSRESFDRLVALLYAELHRIAAGQMAGGAGATLQPTAVVHEAYLKLAAGAAAAYTGRAHFLAAAARAMRHVLIDHARARAADKRWGGLTRVTLGSAESGIAAAEAEILDIDRALERLARRDAEKARIVELRYFGGLSVEETAEVLAISPATVKRHWSFARAWLAREVGGGASGD
jgi:RNA polymerase sigma-70 factor, ECF subfamily